jgi:hypothetical protein
MNSRTPGVPIIVFQDAATGDSRRGIRYATARSWTPFQTREQLPERSRELTLVAPPRKVKHVELGHLKLQRLRTFRVAPGVI